MKLKTIKDFEWDFAGKNQPLCLDMKHKTCCATDLREEAIR